MLKACSLQLRKNYFSMLHIECPIHTKVRLPFFLYTLYMETATIDTEIGDRSRVSPPSYCDDLTPCLYRTILECNLNFTNMWRHQDL